MPTQLSSQAAVKNKQPFVVAIDLGGTSLRVATVDFNGKLIKRASTPTHAEEGVGAVIDRIVDRVIETVGQDDLRRAAAVAMGVPGPYEPRSGVVVSPPNLPGWDHVPIRDIMKSRLGVRVFVGNDANVAALGEHRFGAGRGVDNMIYITISTGVGGGIIADGKLFLGSEGGAGEVGHMTIDMNGPLCSCGNVGCLEAIASGTAIARMAKARIRDGATSSLRDAVEGNIEEITAELVVREARAGDILSNELIRHAAIALGVGVVNLAHLFDPSLIVIGGGVSNAGPLLFQPVDEIVDQRTMRIVREHLRVVPAALGGDTGLIGAAALALDELGVPQASGGRLG
ncbi:MAG: ROK family protein [Chloroflexi bacterium]|nr:ROK family protein [Chloroflexota bacterium]